MPAEWPNTALPRGKRVEVPYRGTGGGDRQGHSRRPAFGLHLRRRRRAARN